MDPTTMPRLEPIKVIFVDVPSGVAIENVLHPNRDTFTDFALSLHSTSSSVWEKLDGLPECLSLRRGLGLEDGCFWYRIVTPVRSRNGDLLAPRFLERSAWKTLDSSFAFDNLVAEMTLGVTTEAAWIEVQHNLQKQRDEAKAKELQVTAATKLTEQPIPEDGPGPAVETRPYEGPVIVNGSRRDPEPAAVEANESGANSASTGLEKFPDVEMTDHPYVLDTFDQGPYILSSGNELQAQSHLFSQAQVPQYWPPQNTVVHQIHYPSDELNHNNNQLRSTAESFLLLPPPNNCQNNHNSSHLYSGRGRGGGRGSLPSYTPRHGPFPAQIGEPDPVAFADWKATWPTEDSPFTPPSPWNSDEEEQLTLETEAAYHNSFQTGSPRSRGSMRSKQSFKKNGHHQNSASSHRDNSIITNTPPFGYGHDDSACNLFGIGMRHDLQYGGGLQDHPVPRFVTSQSSLCHPTGAWTTRNGFSFTYGGNRGDTHRVGMNVHESINETKPNVNTNPLYPYSPYSNDPESVSCYDSQVQPHTQYPTQFQDFLFLDPRLLGTQHSALQKSRTAIDNFSGPKRLNSMESDTNSGNPHLMKESDIYAHTEGRDVNPPPRFPSSTASRQFANNCSPLTSPRVTSTSVHPSPALTGYKFYGQSISNAAGYKTTRQYHHGASAATFETADHFNAMLNRSIERAPKQQLDPALEKNANGSKNAEEYKMNRHKQRFRANLIACNRQSQKPKTTPNVPLPSPKINMSPPPVGDFSPPKPRTIRENRAKRVFDLQEKGQDKKEAQDGDTDSTIDNQETGMDMAANETADVVHGPGNVNFTAAVKRNRPEQKMRSTDIKFGFEDMGDMEQDFSFQEESDLTEPRPLSTHQNDPLALNERPSTHAKELASRRLRTKMANRLKEVLKAQEVAKKIEEKVEMQREGRKERAERRASTKFGEIGEM